MPVFRKGSPKSASSGGGKKTASGKLYFTCSLKDNKSFNPPLPANIVVAVHSKGLDIMERKKKSAMDSAIVLIHLPYQRILKWGHNKKSFVISTSDKPTQQQYNFETKQGEKIMEAIVANVEAIMDRRQKQESAAEFDEFQISSEEIREQLDKIKDDVEFLRKALEKGMVARSEGVSQFTTMMDKIRDSFNCAPKLLCKELLESVPDFKDLREIQQEYLDLQVNSEGWMEMRTCVPVLPVREGVEISTDKIYDLRSDDLVMCVRQVKDSKGNTRGRIRNRDGIFGWTTITDVDNNMGLKPTRKKLDAYGNERSKRKAKATLNVDGGKVQLPRKADLMGGQSEEDFMASMGLSTDGSGSSDKPNSIPSEVLDDAAPQTSSMFVMPVGDMGDDDVEEEDNTAEAIAERVAAIGGVDIDGDGTPDVDVDVLIETLEVVVKAALESDDEDALDLERIVLELETRLNVPPGFLREEFDDIIDDEVMRIIDEDDED